MGSGFTSDASVESLLERQELFDRLIRIQRSISHGAPLQEVLDAITQGASELIGEEIAGLRLIDDNDPAYCELVSAFGVPEDILERIQRTPVGEGAGGRAIRENGLIILSGYSGAPDALEPFKSRGLESAMAAPVHEKGRVVGSLVVASFATGRTYSELEQEALLAFAEHTSLAISDARAMDALRQAQKSRDMFMAMASHGLKTPLTVIMGTLLTLEKRHEDLPTDMVREMLHQAYLRAVELDRSIARMLEGARAELAGGAQSAFVPEVIAAAISGFDQTRELRLSGIPELSLTLDVESVHQVLGILLENAVAHSPDATPIGLDASLVGDSLIFRVTNEGALPADIDKDALFQPFKRGADARSPGVGLGLYIASELTRAMGAALTVDSADGAGGADGADGADGKVCFTLRVPVSPPEPDAG